MTKHTDLSRLHIWRIYQIPQLQKIHDIKQNMRILLCFEGRRHTPLHSCLYMYHRSTSFILQLDTLAGSTVTPIFILTHSTGQEDFCSISSQSTVSIQLAIDLYNLLNAPGIVIFCSPRSNRVQTHSWRNTNYELKMLRN